MCSVYNNSKLIMGTNSIQFLSNINFKFAFSKTDLSFLDNYKLLDKFIKNAMSSLCFL